MIVLQQPGHMLSFSNLEQMALASGVAARLLIAALFGGLIGLDRELHQKPSGVRTNLLICFAAALFTFLSPIIAGEGSSNKGQIASNIVQGIGFWARADPAKSIPREWTHERGHGLCRGHQACGAGLYVPATLATGTVLIVLEGVGVVEKRFNLKLYLRSTRSAVTM